MSRSARPHADRPVDWLGAPVPGSPADRHVRPERDRALRLAAGPACEAAAPVAPYLGRGDALREMSTLRWTFGLLSGARLVRPRLNRPSEPLRCLWDFQPIGLAGTDGEKNPSTPRVAAGTIEA